MHLSKGDTFVFYDKTPAIHHPVDRQVMARGLAGNVLAGDKIYVDDGLLAFTVLRSNLETVECTVDNSGWLGEHKGINLSQALPYTKPFLRRRDREDLQLAVEMQVELVTVSCVRNATDIEEIRVVMAEARSVMRHSEGMTHELNVGNSENKAKALVALPRLLAKIENKSGLEAFESILVAADGIIVDRGYLGVEIDLSSVATVQKLLVQSCTLAGKPILIANHLLESMCELPRPNRSEASDIAATVLYGVDGYILSAETAVGAHPVESLQWLRKICSEAETHLDHGDFQLRILKHLRKPVMISESIASSTVKCAREVDASCIIVSTEAGGIARLIAKYRPSIPIIAGCGDNRTAGQLAVSFGIIPVVVSRVGNQINPATAVHEAMKQAAILGLIEDGNRVVVASGQVDGFLDGSSTFMQVLTVGQDCSI